jgi:hypothetical protein
VHDNAGCTRTNLDDKCFRHDSSAASKCRRSLIQLYTTMLERLIVNTIRLKRTSVGSVCGCQCADISLPVGTTPKSPYDQGANPRQ